MGAIILTAPGHGRRGLNTVLTWAHAGMRDDLWRHQTSLTPQEDLLEKPQKLRNTAEGFMAGLAAAGYTGPLHWRNLQWELDFYDAWRSWEPKDRSPEYFRVFELDGHGRTSQGRELLWQLDKRTSPFQDYRTGINPQPRGLDPREFIRLNVKGATPDEWIELARSFLNQKAHDENTSR